MDGVQRSPNEMKATAAGNTRRTKRRALEKQAATWKKKKASTTQRERKTISVHVRGMPWSPFFFMLGLNNQRH
jgi:hypothetical protein